jgi:cbb3-type cytochrome oxidase subunit 3
MDWGAALEWIFLAGLLIWAGGFCFGEIVKEKNDDLYVIAQVIAAVGKVILLIIFLGVIFYIFKKMVRVSFLNQPREDGAENRSNHQGAGLCGGASIYEPR